MNSSHQFKIVLLNTRDADYICKNNETILEGMVRLGKKVIPVGCRSGGCGVCKIFINHGHYQCKKMSRAHISEEEQRRGFVLACRCQPLSNLTIKVVEKQIKYR